MTTHGLTVIRGAKRAGSTQRRDVDWSVLRPRRDAPKEERVSGDPDVIPILEGWVRLLERQAAAMEK